VIDGATASVVVTLAALSACMAWVVYMQRR